MKTVNVDVAVVGAGPAGLAAAIAARKEGAARVICLERDTEPGGILNQCIHSGFGLHTFKEELTGPEYAQRFVSKAKENSVGFYFDTMVLSCIPSSPSGGDHTLICSNPHDGVFSVTSSSVVFATGCRERTRGAISVPGTRPSGVFTAGAAQRYINILGKMVGKRVVILGSGDIGLIMARRMTLEGAKVLACVELCPYSNGLNRNIVQCLEDYDIPLYLSHTVTNIFGENRLSGVEIAQVGSDKRPIPGTGKRFDCDTLLLSVGLIPENELLRGMGVAISRGTSGPSVYQDMEIVDYHGLFSCGNALHVHDLVDYVSSEATLAGSSAARHALGPKDCSKDYTYVELNQGANVLALLPQRVRTSAVSTLPGELVTVYMRPKNIYRKAKLLFKAQGKVFKEVSREYLAPSEMLSIPLRLADLPSKDGAVEVSIEEVPNA